MAVNRDFEEFFASLNASRVRYLLIGGVAYNFYAPPRATKDIDVWVDPARQNLRLLIAAIGAFGFPTDSIELDVLAATTTVLMLGRVPNRIDVLTRPAGLDWSGAWERRVEGSYGDTPVGILSLKDLLQAKRAAGRPRDLADALTLEEIARRRKST